MGGNSKFGISKKIQGPRVRTVSFREGQKKFAILGGENDSDRN